MTPPRGDTIATLPERWQRVALALMRIGFAGGSERECVVEARRRMRRDAALAALRRERTKNAYPRRVSP